MVEEAEVAGVAARSQVQPAAEEAEAWTVEPQQQRCRKRREGAAEAAVMQPQTVHRVAGV